MPNDKLTPEQHAARLKKAKERKQRLEQAHLNDRPQPLSSPFVSVPLSALTPSDLLK